jgi:PhzF family phenazine biosynthesis protein
MRFFIADAFTEVLFGGNPAGVVLLDEGKTFPPDDIMVKTAAELRYSETAFIQRLGDREFKIRYFTPAAEVDLCGHATIASFYCLVHEGLVDDNCTCLNHTLAGDIEIEVKDGFVMMDMAPPRLIGKIDDESELKNLYEIMGGKFDPTENLLPSMISTGLPDIMMPVSSRKALNELHPDMERLSKLSKEYEVTGVHAFTLDAQEGISCHARNFAPLYDIDEEAATGTSNGALTYYLLLNDIIKDGSECSIIQGESMGRPSLIRTSINGDKIKVGGKAVILADGDIHL